MFVAISHSKAACMGGVVLVVAEIHLSELVFKTQLGLRFDLWLL